MKDLWTAITISDNDFWCSQEFLGQLLSSVMQFYRSYDISDEMLKDNRFKQALTSAIASTWASIYNLSLLLDPGKHELHRFRSPNSTEFDLDNHNEDVNHATDWIKTHISIYTDEIELNRYLEYALKKIGLVGTIKDAYIVDNLRNAWNNTEVLIVHCSEHECKHIII